MMFKNYIYMHLEKNTYTCIYVCVLFSYHHTANAPTFSFINKQDKVKQRDF